MALGNYIDQHNKTLTVDGVAYRVRYYNDDKVVCDTDKLQGKFGDEYPMSSVDNIIKT